MGLHGAARDMTINGRVFKVAHDGPGSKDIGGRNNEIQMNGDGSSRTIQSVVPGSFTDVQVEIDDTRGDHEFLQNLSNEGLPVPVVMTYADNVSYTGDLVLTGEIRPDKSTGIASLSFMGGTLTQI